MATPERQALCASRDFVADDTGEGQVAQALVESNLVDANRLGAAIAHDLLRLPFCFLRPHPHPNNETAFHDRGLDQLRPVSSEMPRGEGAQARSPLPPRRPLWGIGEILHRDEHRSGSLANGLDVRHDVNIRAIESVEFDRIDHLLQDLRSPDDTGDLADDSLFHDFVGFGLPGGLLLKRGLRRSKSDAALPRRNRL